LSERLGYWVKRFAGRSFERIIAVMMPSVALLSFAASLGTTIAIIGAPAFLIVNGLLRQSGEQGLGIFSIAPIGLTLLAAGTLFVLVVGRFLLPARQSGDESVDHFRLDGYYTELALLPESALVGKTIAELESKQKFDLRVVTWFRNKRSRAKPFGKKKTKAGDVLVIRTNPDRLATIHEERGIVLQPVHKYENDLFFSQNNNGKNGDEDEISSRLVQSVVAPKAEIIGKTIGQIDFLRTFGVIVVGVWRQRGALQTELSRIRLREGDVLVMLGDSSSLKRIADDRSFLMLVPFKGEPKMQHKAPLAGGIMLLTVLASALNLVPVVIALLGGAAAMLLTRCISTRQAYQSIDTRIFVFIAGAIPLGLAMETTGAAALLGSWLQGLVTTWSTPWILFTLFILAGLLTQIMSDAATTALLAPIALALARGLGLPPQPFVITVAMAAVASFFTPIGHHGNLLVYGPGRYQFADFLRVGIPLTILIGIIVSILAPIVWPT
jgi:di/tricarboxylate transporter